MAEVQPEVLYRLCNLIMNAVQTPEFSTMDAVDIVNAINEKFVITPRDHR